MKEFNVIFQYLTIVKVVLKKTDILRPQVPEKDDKPPSEEESDSSTHEVKKEEPDSEDDDKDKSPKILYVRCGKCRTYWPGGKEIINHTCVLHPYKRVAFDPAVS